MKRVRILLSILSVSVACVDSHVTDIPPLDQSALLHRVRFDYQSVIMAVGDTVRLQVVASDLNGDTIPIPEKGVTWRSNNSAVQVDSMGRIIARTRTSSAVRIIGSWTLNDVERTDTAIVRTLATRLAVGSVRVTPLDSGRKGWIDREVEDISEIVSLYSIRAFSPQGSPLSTITLEGKFAGNPQLAPFSSITAVGGGNYGVLAPFYLGELWIKTSALIFGTAYRDSAKFTGLYPAEVAVGMTVTSGTNAIVHNWRYSLLQPCGAVLFTNETTSSITVVFDRETASVPCGGSMPASGPLTLLPGQSARRVVSVMGAVQWRGQLTATSADIPRLTGTLTVIHTQ